MNDRLQTPFDSVENAQQYIRLLLETIAEAKNDIASDLGAAKNTNSDRRLQALQIIQFKLDKLEQHLKTSSRLLNDLRTLRRLLFDERRDERNDERHEPTPTGKDSAA